MNGVVKKMIYEQNWNINRETETLKRNQKEILELKITITGIKISLEEFKGKFEQTEENQ
jgi:hypothetical protein